MGKAAIVTKQYMQNNVVFADAVNYFIYGGEPIIQAEDLTPLDSAEVTVPEDAKQRILPKERIRDNIKCLTAMTDGQTVYALIGIENQTEIHYAMPVRNMVYDAISYAGQVSRIASEHWKNGDLADGNKGEYLSGFDKEDRILPVFTLVIYFGPERWDGPTSLHEMFEPQDPKLLNLVSDYQVHLIVPEELSEKDLERFHSDLREVLAFIKHSKDAERLKQLLTENPRYQEMDYAAAQVINECTHSGMKIRRRKERKVDMCKAIDDMRKEAYQGGEKRGENLFASLTSSLLKDSRLEDLQKATEDIDCRRLLYREYGLAPVVAEEPAKYVADIHC